MQANQMNGKCISTRVYTKSGIKLGTWAEDASERKTVEWRATA